MNYKNFYEPRFIDDLKEMLDFIKKDKSQAAEKFKQELKQSIEKLPNFPYQYRKSIFFSNENIRDLIYKGYIILYKIDKDKIFILGITKYKRTF